MPGKQIIFSLLIVHTFSSCSPSAEKPAQCDQYKNGRFTLRSELNGAIYLIERKNSVQHEVNIAEGKTTKWKVIWTDHCTYELWYLPEPPLSREDSLFSNNPVINKILKTTKEYYVFHSSVKATGYQASDTIFVRKQ